MFPRRVRAVGRMAAGLAVALLSGGLIAFLLGPGARREPLAAPEADRTEAAPAAGERGGDDPLDATRLGVSVLQGTVQPETHPPRSWAVPFGREFWRETPTAAPTSPRIPGEPAIAPGRVRDAIERVTHALTIGPESAVASVEAGRYQAIWDDRGLVFSPRGPAGVRAQMRTVSIAAGETVIWERPAQGVAWEVKGNTAQFLLAGTSAWVEHQEARAAGVEWTWIFEDQPGAGADLRIEVEVQGLSFASASASGLHFADAADLARMRISQPVAVDAAGRRWNLDLLATARGFAVSVPATVLGSADYPLAIDPLISAEFGLDQPVEGPTPCTRAAPSVGANEAGWLVAWTHGKGETTDPCVFGARVSPAGELLDPTGILVAPSASEQTTCTVAGNPGGFLVAWSTPKGASTTDWDVVGVRVGDDGTVLDPVPLTVGTGVGSVQSSPAAAGNGENFLVVWRDSRSTGIYGAKVTLGGAVSPPGGFPICTAAYDQFTPSVAALGTNYLVAWQDYRRSTGTQYASDIYGARIAGDGVLLAPTNFPICLRTNSQFHPVVAASGNQFLIVWEDYDLGGNDLLGTRLSADGAVLDPDGLVIAHAPNLQTNPTLAEQQGEFLVAWEDYRDSAGSPFAPEIYFARVREDGVVVDPGGRRLTTASETQGTPAVAGRSGDYFIAWQDARDHSATTLADIRGARILHATQPDPVIGPERFLSPVVNGELTPAVAWLGGSALVVWADNRGSLTNGLDILGVRVGESGIPLDANALAIGVGPGRQSDPAVAADGTNFLVVWSDYRNAPAAAFHADIAGTVVSPVGDVLAPHGLVLCGLTNDQSLPAVTSLAEGFLVVWQDARASAGTVVRQDIYGTRVTSTGEMLDPGGFPICTNAANQTAPSVAGVGTEALVVWTDARNGVATDIYGARVSENGTAIDVGGVPICRAAGSQFAPAVAGDGVGYLVAWTDARSGVSNPDIYAATFRRDGAVDPNNGFPVRTGSALQTAPAVAFNGFDYFVVWQEARSSLSNSFDIFGTRVPPGAGKPTELVFLIDTEPNSQLAPAATAGLAGRILVASQGFRASAPRAVLSVVNLEAQPTVVSSAYFPAAGFVLRFRAALGENYRIDASEDLQVWTALSTFTCTNASVEFIDAAATNAAHRYYRVLLLP